MGDTPAGTGSAADFLKGQDRATEDGDDACPTALEVLEENWDAVQVFMACQQSWVPVGMAGAFALGFSALELDAACRLVGLADEGRRQAVAYAREMGQLAAEALNARKA